MLYTTIDTSARVWLGTTIGDGPDPTWRLRHGGRLCGGTIAGGVRTGKTTLARHLATNAAQLDNIQVWFACGTLGADDPPDETIGLAPHVALREASETVRSRRQRATAHTPATDRPDILVVVNDFTTGDDEACAHLEFVARLGQAAGVAIVATTNRFGTQPWPRGLATTHTNLVVMPSNDRSYLHAHRGLGLPDVDFTALPPGPGHGFYIDGAAPDTRPIPFRGTP